MTTIKFDGEFALNPHDYMTIDDVGELAGDYSSEIDYLRDLLRECYPFIVGTGELEKKVNKEAFCRCNEEENQGNA